MKEAAGEANMTVITIVLIGAVAAIGLLIVPRLMKNMKKSSCCTNAGGKIVDVTNGTTCVSVSGVAFNYTQYSECYNAS